MALCIAGSISHGGPAEIFLVPANEGRDMWRIKKSLVANRKAVVAVEDFLSRYLIHFYLLIFLNIHVHWCSLKVKNNVFVPYG